LRRPSERLALVEYIAASPTLQENEHLEWKSGFDLSRRPDAGKVAKQLIGFGNRDPARAKRLTGGCAFVLLGVEAGELSGVPVWDSADIESWLSRFVPSDLIYDVHYVSAGGKDILVLEVDPPRQGDSIFCLQASTGESNANLSEGTIYVRRGGKTEPANAAEIAMLTARARSGAGSAQLDLEVAVEAQELTALPREPLKESIRERWIDQERLRLLKPLPRNSVLPITVGETRTPAQFEEEVEIYFREVRADWPTFALSQHVKHGEPSLTLAVTNGTDENFEDVVVEVEVPLPSSCVGTSPGEVVEALSVGPLVEWAENPIAKIDRSIFGAAPDAEISSISDERTKVRFPPLHVYPQTSHALEELTLALAPEWAGSDLEIEWRIAAANTRGVITGSVAVTIPEAS
jgi:Putative DNA-binding domain